MWRPLTAPLRAAAPGLKSTQSQIHATSARAYPKAATLRLPDNIQDINASEMGCFSPMRTRDISGSVISSHENQQTPFKIDVTLDSDPHIGPYDCRGAVSLSSSMQSNVPSPFGGQLNYLSMPGSQWGQGYKYLSDHLHSSHYLNLRNSYNRASNETWSNSGTICSYHTSAIKADYLNYVTSNNSSVCSIFGYNICIRKYSDNKVDDQKPKSRKEQLKQAVAAYGSTVIVFHVAISLASLGTSYLLVSSGLDVTAWLEYFGLADGAFASKVTANAGTFVVAYAVHKVFAPVRIGITLTATPFIVRYLRRIGILKAAAK